MWLVLAVAASAFWGITYVLDEQVYRHVSVVTTMFVHTLVISIVALLVAWKQGVLVEDFKTILASRHVALLFVSCALTFMAAEFLISFSIEARNATLAALIEISYPIFTALFAYLVFGENQLNLGTGAGGLLIGIGVLVVYWSST